MTPPKEVALHGSRLAILGCLHREGPLTLAAVAREVCLGEGKVSHHARVLGTLSLVGPTGDLSGDRPVYEARLEGQPDWIREAVDLRTTATLPCVGGMKCDGCDGLLQHRSEVVAVYGVGDGTQAKLVIEDPPGSGKAADLGARAKYHPSCYDEARERDPSLPPLSA